jgi:hypothetical protein
MISQIFSLREQMLPLIYGGEEKSGRAAGAKDRVWSWWLLGAQALRSQGKQDCLRY